MDESSVTRIARRGLLSRFVRAGAEQIRQQSVSTRHALRRLPVQSKGHIDVFPLAELCVEQPATLRILSGIMSFRWRSIVGSPGGHERVSTLLRPSVEV